MKSFKEFYCESDGLPPVVQSSVAGGKESISDWYNLNRDRMEKISADYDHTSESDILDDIKDLPSNFTHGTGLVNRVEWLVDRENQLMKKGRSDEVEIPNDYHGRPVQQLKQDMTVELMKGLDKYYGQNFTSSGLSSTVPGSSKYMNYNEVESHSVPTDWGVKASQIFMDMRTDILHHWKEKRRAESEKEPGQAAVTGGIDDRGNPRYRLD
jgi:hypothetical protein